MPTVIIYPVGEGIAVLWPADTTTPIYEVGRRDVPAGVPFRLIDSSELPVESVYRDAWRADFSTPDGVGVGPEAWAAEQAGGAA